MAQAGQRVGPFAIRNGAGRDYDLRILPALLGQRRDGGLFARLDRASRRRAHDLLTPNAARADFRRGRSVGASALVRRVPRGGSLYAGVLFEATPSARAPEEQVVAVLRLNARVLLDPPRALQRVRFTSEPIRAEQAGERRLALRVPVENRGNLFVHAAGRVGIRDAAGRIVARLPLKRVEVLPGAVVELPGDVAEELPAGDYTLAAALRAGDHRFRARGSMRLVDTNEVAAAAARLTSFAPPSAYRGSETTLQATVRNTGNVPFAPRASFVVRGQDGRLLRSIPAKLASVAPGASGEARARLEISRDGRPFEVTLRLTHEGRLLDERTVSATPAAAPSLADRIADFVTAHALVLLGLAAMALLALLVAGAIYVRRLRSQAAGVRTPA